MRARQEAGHPNKYRAAKLLSDPAACGPRYLIWTLNGRSTSRSPTNSRLPNPKNQAARLLGARPSIHTGSCSRVAVSCCFPPVHRTDSARSASSRGPTASQTGGRRGTVSVRIGPGFSRYFPNRTPRNSELFRDVSPRATFHQHLVANDMDLIHPEHPPSGPEAQRFGNRRQTPRWITFRAASGSLSERRAQRSRR
jgi:hypothetical protein